MTHDQGAFVNLIRDLLSTNSTKELRDIAPRIPAAVLVPFCFADDEWHLLFTKRSNGVAKHQGEISFPGGAAEDGDVDLVDTAVREACEEIGLCKESIEVLGVMQPVHTISNYCVLPVVGFVQWPSDLRLNPSEVEQILMIPINWLKDENNWHVEEFHFATGKSKSVIHYNDYKGEHLWGFTAGLAQKITSLL
jgi:8-oxo-dGTP pyrophosphatase MutT (NUDIX family)